MWGLDKGPAPGLAGLPSPYRKHLRNKGPAPPSAGLPSPSSLRDATSPKVRGFGCTGNFAFSKKLPLWGSWREAPERARMLAGRLRPGLEGAYDGADFRKAHSKLTRFVSSAGLALSVIASRCHLSQSERPWQSAKFPVWNLYALLPQGEPSGAALRLHAFAKGSHFGGAGAKRLRGRARQREPCAFV